MYHSPNLPDPFSTCLGGRNVRRPMAQPYYGQRPVCNPKQPEPTPCKEPDDCKKAPLCEEKPVCETKPICKEPPGTEKCCPPRAPQKNPCEDTCCNPPVQTRGQMNPPACCNSCNSGNQLPLVILLLYFFRGF